MQDSVFSHLCVKKRPEQTQDKPGWRESKQWSDKTGHSKQACRSITVLTSQVFHHQTSLSTILTSFRCQCRIEAPYSMDVWELRWNHETTTTLVISFQCLKFAKCLPFVLMWNQQRKTWSLFVETCSYYSQRCLDLMFIFQLETSCVLDGDNIKVVILMLYNVIKIVIGRIIRLVVNGLKCAKAILWCFKLWSNHRRFRPLRGGGLQAWGEEDPVKYAVGEQNEHQNRGQVFFF